MTATCGQGLAENSVLPGKLGELIGAMAEVLRLHMKALDPTDESAKPEYEAYSNLTRRLEDAAGRLRDMSSRMAGYRDLPMGRHDMAAMGAPELIEAFERFVSVEQELQALLQSKLEQDREMLVAMAGGSANQ